MSPTKTESPDGDRHHQMIWPPTIIFKRISYPNDENCQEMFRLKLSNKNLCRIKTRAFKIANPLFIRLSYWPRLETSPLPLKMISIVFAGLIDILICLAASFRISFSEQLQRRQGLFGGGKMTPIYSASFYLTGFNVILCFFGTFLSFQLFKQRSSSGLAKTSKQVFWSKQKSS